MQIAIIKTHPFIVLGFEVVFTEGYIVNKISKDGYYKPEEIVLMPIPGSGSKEFLFCVKMYCEM